MEDLIAFLRARLDEDERIARDAGGVRWLRPEHPGAAVVIFDSRGEPVAYDEGWPTEGQQAHIARHDPARVLREVEAKRQMLEEHGDVNDGSCVTCVDGQWGYPTHGGSSPQSHPCRTLSLLALPYSDHPDYREEWKS